MPKTRANTANNSQANRPFSNKFGGEAKAAAFSRLLPPLSRIEQRRLLE